MTKRASLAVATIAVLIATPLIARDDDTMPEIDQRSYNLGIMGGFSEVVRLGVKQLALSEVMTPEEMDGVMDDAMVIAERNEVQMWRETMAPSRNLCAVLHTITRKSAPASSSRRAIAASASVTSVEHSRIARCRFGIVGS